VALGQQLRALAHAAIDVSDGLLHDLGHILSASGVGAELQESQMPVHPALTGLPPSALSADALRRAVLAGGDLYELCFTAPSRHHQQIKNTGVALDLDLSCIGTIRKESGLVVYDQAGIAIPQLPLGFDHFRI
jgi:thiamine-monophosphate kinase